MSNLSVKRQRANTNGDVATPCKPLDDCRNIIATFDESTVRELLLAAATKSSQIAAQVFTWRDDIVNAENNGVIDCDHFS